MPENFDDLAKKVNELEARVTFLEGKKQIAGEQTFEEPKRKQRGYSFPTIVAGIIGIIFIFNFLPSIFSPYGYFRATNLVFGLFGLGLVIFAAKSIFSYKSTKKPEVTERLSTQPVTPAGEPVLAKPEESNFEFKLAANWFAVVGIIAIIFAVVFFLKYAFDNGLIGPVGQVALGLFFGFMLIFAGELLRSKVHNWSQIISGGGVVVLYLSIWACWGLFHLISPYIPLLSMSVITILSSLLAIRYAAVYIGVLGVIGGFATPILLGKGFDSQVVLMSYIVILNLGVLSVSFFKNWRELNIATFAGTYIVILSWIGTHWRVEKFLPTLAFLTIIFLIFAISLFIYNLVYKKEAEESDVILMLTNAVVYFGIGYFLMTDAAYKDLLGFFAFGLSVFYFILGYLSYQKFKESSYLTLSFLGISILFLTLAVPLQVKKNIITIVWAAEGVSLLLLGFIIGSQRLRVTALLIYVLVIIRLFAFDTQITVSQFILILNKRFLTFVISACSMGLASYLYVKYKEKIGEDEKIILPALLISLNIILIWVFSWESISYYGKKIEQVRKSQLQSLETDVRVLGVKVAQVPATGSGQLERTPSYYPPNYNYPSPSPYNRNIPKRNTPPRQNYNYQAPKQLSVQDLEKIKGLESARDVSLSVIWLLYSIMLLGIGIGAKYKPIRLFALGFLMLTIFKVFVYDSRNLQQGYRIVAFMILGTILLAISLIYQRYKTQISIF